MTKMCYILMCFSICAVASVCAVSVSSAAPVAAEQLTSALHWRSVGPYHAGRVNAVAGVTDQPNLFYMGTADGGVWETTNYGQRWKNISDKYFDTGVIGAIAVAPSDPKVIYVGTGDPNIRNTMMTGDGIYKSTNGGKTWTHVGLKDTHVIARIVVSPRNPDVVYVAALGHVWAPNSARGVYKSSDGGKHWKKVLYLNDKTGAIDLAINPHNPQILYAAMWQAYRRPWTLSSGGPGSGIYKSTNGGQSWDNITHNSGLPKGIFGRVGLAVAPSNPNVVYADIQAKYQGKQGGLFRSDDSGRTWRLVDNSSEVLSRAFYTNSVSVDPKDPNTVYVPRSLAIYVSHDGGKTVKPLYGGVDNHELWINHANPNLMADASDFGAVVSRDDGRTWSSQHNQPTGQFYYVNLDNQFPFWIYSVQQDGDGYSPAAGPSAVRLGAIPPIWTRVAADEQGPVVPQPGKPWITYALPPYGDMVKENRHTGVVWPISPWPSGKNGSAAFALKYRFGWTHEPVVFAPGNPDELLIGAQVVLESKDQGISWKAISPDLTRNDKSKQQRSGGPISFDTTSEENFDTLSSLAISPVNDDVIWTGSDDGLVYVTEDGGAHWSEVRPPSLPKWSTITCIEPSHTNVGAAYFTASRFGWDDFKPYVYKTVDYGKHWTKITSGLPDDEYAESVRQDPNNPGLIFLGTDKTVYFSTNSGNHWHPLSLNLPPVKVTDIAIQPEQHAVVLATFGRSFWVLDNLQFLEQLSDASVADNVPYLFKPQQTWLVKRSMRDYLFPADVGGPSTIGGENLPVGATVFFYLPENYDGQSVKVSFTTTGGKLIRSFMWPQVTKTASSEALGPKLKLHPGVNRFLWNFRYPSASPLKGFGANGPEGPEVVPGTYDVVLNYGGVSLKQPFMVKLDPRLSTTPRELQVRFDLLTRIHSTVNTLDETLNRAVDVRRELQKTESVKRRTTGQIRTTIVSLNRDIDSVVNFKLAKSKGGSFNIEASLLHRPRLRSWLISIGRNVSRDFVPVTSAQRRVSARYIKETHRVVSRLKVDIIRAREVLSQKS